MTSPLTILQWISWICLVALAASMFLGLGVDTANRRACRRAGGVVIYTNNAEWHCVGATPERGGQ